MPADAAPSHVWVPELADPGSVVPLSAEAAHHVARVCRARAGDPLTLTDGRGGLASARVASIKPRVEVTIERVERAARPERRSELWCGAPEGQRADWLVEKLAELGVGVFQPIDTERARWEAGGPRLERWRRLAVAALGQSRRVYLLEIRPPVRLQLADESGREDIERWFADPAGTRAADLRAGEGVSQGIIGPAAGLSPSERASVVERGFRSIALSDGRLRTETAALAWSAWWAAAGTAARGSQES